MTERVLLKKIGEQIKRLRKERGMSQQEFAAKLDYEKSNASRLESGKVNLRIATLHKVANVLNVSLEELLTFK